MIGRYQQFSYIVSVINRQIQKIERDEMEKYGYKGAFAQYLMAMRRNPNGVTSAQLSEMCDKDKAAVSRVITEMIEKGLVVRKRANEKLYRAKLINIYETRILLINKVLQIDDIMIYFCTFYPICAFTFTVVYLYCIK